MRTHALSPRSKGLGAGAAVDGVSVAGDALVSWPKQSIDPVPASTAIQQINTDIRIRWLLIEPDLSEGLRICGINWLYGGGLKTRTLVTSLR